jgi:hypothetical protein
MADGQGPKGQGDEVAGLRQDLTLHSTLADISIECSISPFHGPVSYDG